MNLVVRAGAEKSLELATECGKIHAGVLRLKNESG
jgi:hypothetical protein